MASRFDLSKWVMVLAAIALSAAGWWFGAQLHPVWWAAWLAPLPILWLATRTRASVAAIAAFVSCLLGVTSQWHYARDLLHLPLFVIALLLCAPGVIFALTVLLYRRLSNRGRYFAAAMSVPVLWVAMYYLNSVQSPNGTWGDLGYTQLDALPVIQIASLTGLWGIGFLVMLLPASAAVFANRQAPQRERWLTLGVAIAVVALALGYGTWRLGSDATARQVRIGLVSIAGPIRPAVDSPKGQNLEQRYVTALDSLGQQGVQMAVIPETVLALSKAELPSLAAVATQYGMTLVGGMDYQPEGQTERNASMAFDAKGDAPTLYFKHHLMPGFEDRYKPGDGYTLLPGDKRVGLTICKDMDFPAMGRSYAARNVQLLLVPAWDFEADGWLHSRMAIMRGVESGFAIARAARDGALTLSDDRGRVLAEAPSNLDADANVIGTLPLRDTHTLYSRWGDWFAWLDLAALIVLLGLALRPTRRR